MRFFSFKFSSVQEGITMSRLERVVELENGAELCIMQDTRDGELGATVWDAALTLVHWAKEGDGKNSIHWSLSHQARTLSASAAA